MEDIQLGQFYLPLEDNINSQIKKNNKFSKNACKKLKWQLNLKTQNISHRLFLIDLIFFNFQFL